MCIRDSPRTEEPKAIIDDILEGMKDSDTPMQVIVDRPEAIHWALAHAQKEMCIRDRYAHGPAAEADRV